MGDQPVAAEPEHDPRSVLDRPAREPDLVVRYGDAPDDPDDPVRVADVYLPVGDAAGRFVLLVHGGFWQAEYDRVHVRPMAEALATTGHLVASVEYRRVGMPGGGWPGTLDDLAAAVDRLPVAVGVALEVRDVRVEVPDEVVVVGHSAGGHLACWTGLRHLLPAGSRWHRETSAVDLVVALAPVADLRAADEAGLGDDAVASLYATRRSDDPEPATHADPAAVLRTLRAGATAPPVVVLQGDEDVQVPASHARAYAALARRLGLDLDLVELAGTEHFALIDPRSNAWSTVLRAIGRELPDDRPLPGRTGDRDQAPPAHHPTGEAPVEHDRPGRNSP